MDARFILVASSFGRTLAQEVSANGAGFLVAPDGKSVAKPLLKAASRPVLSHWLGKLARCPRLLPLEKKVFIVVNEEHLPLYHDWATLAGFPVANIISNGSVHSAASRPGVLSDVALAAERINATGWLFAADADYCFQPHFGLQRFVEAAVVSNRLTVAMTAATDSAAGEAGAFVVPASAPATSKGDEYATKVASMSLDATPSALRTLPLVAMPPSATQHLADAAANAPSAWQSLERFVAGYAAEQPVTGYYVPAAFCVRTLHHLLFADRFSAHFDARFQQLASESAHVAMMHTGARSTAGTTALLGTAPSKAELVSHALLDSPHTLDVALEVHNFGFNEAEALVTRSQLEGASLLLPARFRQGDKWDYSRRRPEHACYTTSNHTYGVRSPVRADMPMTWHGAKGDFTKTFAGMVRDQGLRTYVERSKVHRAFDEL